MISPKRMSSGKYIDLSEFTEDDVNLHDINISLNHIYRFTGHHKDEKPLTVAQHEYLVMTLASHFFPNDKVVKFNALMHDMPEAFYGDTATPLKRLLKAPYRHITEHIDKMVYKALWLIPEPFTEEIEQKTKVCDLMALDIERRMMWKDQRGKDLWPDEPKNSFSMREKQELFKMAQSFEFVDLEEYYKEMING